ncbi:MAG: LysE family translocator [Chloroflexi bacterium]|nr:MAG: LysE family translocator [Chloroflexota bacterium]
MSGERLLAFALAATVILVIPGPSVLFVVGRALAHGRPVALASVVGNEIGELVVAAAVALGVGAIVERSLLVFTVMKLAGACYLVYLGVRALRERRRPVVFESAGRPCGTWRAIRQGFVVGVANPKTAVFFVAVLPQFVDRASGHVPVQMLLLGLTFTLIALVTDSAWGLAASGARAWLGRSPRRLGLITGVGGVAMIGLGVGVAVTGNKD